MAAVKMINTVSDKLIKVNENFTINRFDNGFMIEVSGKTKKGDYANAKIMVSNLDELLVLVRETCEMEIDT